MATIECKICGGFSELPEGRTLGSCVYCGNQVTLPRVSDEAHAAAFNRGNHFRRIGEFDKALAVYERIVQQDEANAEAHWCCALCRFGIEYVQDPATGMYLPTCHRASYDSFLQDVDVRAAIAHSDADTARQYQRDAEAIAQVQRDILATIRDETPFDVFICYKETDADGQRTRDSLLAQDVYYQLTDQGMRVFFARITLEDKPGTAYEPYIFAALNTAKVMVVVGTKPEHLGAVWVRNEWSRFLALMKHDRTRLLIPCYRDMDPYDMPEQLSILQSYDMSRIGFLQDLVRGIRKVVGEEKPAAPQAQSAASPQAAPSTEPLLRRIALFLEDGDWQSADEYCERVLDIDPENARAYVGKLMAALHVTHQEKLRDQAMPFDQNPNYIKALRFADEELVKALRGAIAHIKERNERVAKEAVYSEATAALAAAKTDADYAAAGKLFKAMGDFSDAREKAALCETKSLDWQYEQAQSIFSKAHSESDFRAAQSLFKALGNHREAPQMAAKSAECAEVAEAAEREQHRRKEEAAKQARLKAQQRTKLFLGVSTAAICIVIAVVLLVTQVVTPANMYSAAVAYEAGGNTVLAAIHFGKAGGYKDARERSNTLWDGIAERHTLSAASTHTVGLRASGTVVAVGDNGWEKCNVSHWSDIVAISAGDEFTVGLRSDGAVVAVGSSIYGECKVSRWSDIVAISAGDNHTVGLRSDGTVVAVGSNYDGQCKVAHWSDIVAISAGYGHTVALRSDGTVVAVGNNDRGQCDVSDWSDIVAISAGSDHTVGLRSDGTVVAVGYNYNGECDVSRWSDIVAISAGDNHTVGLRTDGTVVAVGSNRSGQCDVSHWSDIVAISAGKNHTVGLRPDGTVVTVGYNYSGQCGVSSWRLKTVPRPTLPE